MRWPWWKRRNPDRLPASDDAEQAAEARLNAEEQLLRARRRAPEVREIAEQLRQHRRVNHFAELLGQSFGGNR